MARQPRIALPGYPHHVIQRGNNRQPVFFAERDYRYYLTCLGQAKIASPCRIYAYVLMTNHVHLLVEPAETRMLGRFMQSVGRRYVRYVNAAYGRSGTLWEGRFKSAVVSRDEYLIACSRYIELNPVRAHMVQRPEEYPWSSYRCRALGTPDRLLDDDPWYGGLGATPEGRQRVYREWVESSRDHAQEWERIREATQRGRAIGKDRFQQEIEAAIGRRLVDQPRGRPKKSTLTPFYVVRPRAG